MNAAEYKGFVWGTSNGCHIPGENVADASDIN